jgi:GNAT superfamily N-acetyltransferase
VDSRQATVELPTEGTPVTTSGAHLAAIETEVAVTFLARLGGVSPEPIEIALGALEDDGTLIGVAVLGPTIRQREWATVAVTPARRRLKVGSDLLGTLLRHAGTRGLRYLACCQRAGAAETASTALLRSMGLISARRVCQGAATLLVVVVSQP